MNSRFFDIDVLINLDSQAWIVDKNQPNIPIIKIPKSDFNLIKSGIYLNQGNKIDFNGRTFWLPTDLVNQIKIKAKSNHINLTNLAVSLQEFLNKGIIDNMHFEINMDIFDEVKNTNDDIYIICSKQTKRNYDSLILKLEEKLKENGILIKNFYYISENFYNQNEDDIIFKKMRLLIQHLVGYKSDGNKFIDKSITKYSKLYYYDNNYDTLKFTDDINNLLEIMVVNTDNGLKDVIKEDIIEYKPLLIVNKVNDNELNRMDTKKVILNFSKILMFESFISYDTSKKI